MQCARRETIKAYNELVRRLSIVIKQKPAQNSERIMPMLVYYIYTKTGIYIHNKKVPKLTRRNRVMGLQ